MRTVYAAFALLLAVGCNPLMESATGGRWVSRNNIKIINDSSRDVCKVKVLTEAGELADEQGLTGVSIKPGEEGVAQVEEDLGTVVLEIYSCDDVLLGSETVDVTNPKPVRVH